MLPTQGFGPHRVLLVDDDDDVRGVLHATLESKGFDVAAAANVTQALKLITTESFDALTTDLHMPSPSDGFAVVTAMRHSQPNTLTLVIEEPPELRQFGSRGLQWIGLQDARDLYHPAVVCQTSVWLLSRTRRCGEDEGICVGCATDLNS
jgi:Response regulator receiver domain